VDLLGQTEAVGAVSAAFLIGYGCLRFAVEFLREPMIFLGFLR